MSTEGSALLFVLPGGAYEFHADYEAEPVAAWLQGLGHRAEVLRYPVAPAVAPAALNVVQGAVAQARDSFDGPIGVLGFSAGGHLAGHAALSEDGDPAGIPDFAVLAYPVVSLGAEGHVQSRRNLLGAHASDEEGESVSLDRLVHRDSVPFFIWHTANDEIVPVAHSLRLASALARHGSPFELHVFPNGPHGLALAEDAGSASAWTDLCARWLRDRVRS